MPFAGRYAMRRYSKIGRSSTRWEGRSCPGTHLAGNALSRSALAFYILVDCERRNLFLKHFQYLNLNSRCSESAVYVAFFCFLL